ncbi:MAG: DUF1592 domain-containing protein [Acidobacteriota bacterium]
MHFEKVFATLVLFAAVSFAQSAALTTYCAPCHSGSRAEVGVTLDALSSNADLGERVLRQIRAQTMPPVGAPRPDAAVYKSMVDSLSATLDKASKTPSTPVSNVEIAKRLAALVWDSAPDLPLLGADLQKPAVVEAQVKRMLADPKSQALVTGFFRPWLQLDLLDTAKPDPKVFPDFDEVLRDSMRQETELFLASQLRDDRAPVELLTANYTYLNERLAKHYGIAGISGTQFQRVNYKGVERAGLLGHASILTFTSQVEKHFAVGTPSTSPATRGKWIRQHFLDVNPPTPLPNIPAPDFSAAAPLSATLRALPASPCTNCHQNFFPLGYALENFDELGRWRTQELGQPVNAAAVLHDGVQFTGPSGLGAMLLQHQDTFLTAVTEKMLSFSIEGRPGLSHSTRPELMPLVRRVLRETDSADRRWSALIAAVVRSPRSQ